MTGYGSTPTSVRRQRRMSKPTRLFPGSDVNVPILTEQNPAEMVGESVFDCRPPGLPVSIPLSGFSPAMISGARDCTSHQQLQQSQRPSLTWTLMKYPSVVSSDSPGTTVERMWRGRVALPGSTPRSDYVPAPCPGRRE